MGMKNEKKFLCDPLTSHKPGSYTNGFIPEEVNKYFFFCLAWNRPPILKAQHTKTKFIQI